jgi:branched-subunit amino acid transport protein
LPGWLLLHLRYVGVAVFPALIAPLLAWPAATGGAPDPVRWIAAIAALLAALRFGIVWAILAGMGALYALQYAGL